MASARARLGKARRNIIKRQKTTGVVTGALSTLGTVAAFGAGQAKKAKTAWREYEAGYKELGGEGFERPKFGQKGYFKGPEGEVRIGASMYDRSKIQEAGSFLGSDAAAILTPEMREQYLGRIAPGRDMTVEEVSTTRESLRPKMPFTEDKYDVDEEFGYDAWTAESPVYQQGEEPGLRTVGQDWQTPPPFKQEPDQNPQGMYKGWLRSKPIVQTTGSEGWGKSYARGGDFITNGPQEILVGDNPGGRERVTIEPLPFKKRNWLESLYENNKRRKKY